MKNAFRRTAGRVLSRIGFTETSRLAGLKEQLTRSEENSRRLKAALEKSRAEVADLRQRLEHVEERAARRRVADDEKVAARLAKADRAAVEAAARLKKQDEERASRIGELNERTDQAARSSRLAREQLMAVETKLDIVEGAINVLDRRTRATIPSYEPRS